jgi:hypothetical protein
MNFGFQFIHEEYEHQLQEELEIPNFWTPTIRSIIPYLT